MIKSTLVILVGLLAIGCGGASSSTLWIAMKNDELHIQLSPIEPNPF
jgi:hypothetical protein